MPRRTMRCLARMPMAIVLPPIQALAMGTATATALTAMVPGSLAPVRMIDWCGSSKSGSAPTGHHAAIDTMTTKVPTSMASA